MSTNISKKKRDDLLDKIKQIRAFIAAAPQDENTGNLLSYLSDLEKDVNGKKYGLVFEEHREEIDEVLDTHTPVLTEDADLFIDHGGQMNFLIEGDNLASLKLLEKTHKGKIDLIYIDPPYNTGASNWIYDNDYVDGNDLFKHSKWLSMMQSRLTLAKNLLTDKGVLICAIDENESATLRLLLDDIFGADYEYNCITIIHNPRGIQGKNFSYTNEFAYFVIPKGDKIIGKRHLSDDEIYWSPLRNWGSESLRTDARNCFYPIIVKDEKIIGFGDVSPNDYHPKKNELLEDGSIAVYPIDAKGVERKWRYESHQNNTIKADEIIQYFRTEKIIRCSATPKGIAKAEVIEIPEEEVIAAGLIKKMLVINQDFPQTVETEDQTAYLLERALQKQRELRAAYLQMDVDINPLIIVQIPNKSETLLDGVERWFEAQGLTYENGQLAVWLSDRHENLGGIDAPAAPSTAVIIKQAVATGWDCPRAQILVKLRDNMDETFEIQTIGRIRRMPEAKHYGSDLLDSCYLYTFDEKFTAGVKMALDKGALNACTLFLKSEYKDITLTGEQRSMISMPRNPQKALRAIWLYAEENLGVGADKEENWTRLQAAGYILRDDVVRHTVSGETATLDFSSSDMNTISVTEKLNTHKHGRDYHQKIGKIGLEIGMEYSFMNTIIRKLFDKNFNYAHKILALEPREVYAFVLNNADRLRHLVREAMAAEMTQMQLDVQAKSLFEFHIPQSCLFTYNGEAKTQIIYKKNVYQNYLSSAAPRSTPEVKFEKFCEHSGNVEWWYKNGDKGSEYFSIVYGDNSEKQKLFYPDYIVGISGEIWIIETKGGFDRSGNSQDIDIYTPKKFEVLKAYLDAHGLKGGIVRNDATTDELCICMEHYSDDIGSDDWVLLEKII